MNTFCLSMLRSSIVALTLFSSFSATSSLAQDNEEIENSAHDPRYYTVAQRVRRARFHQRHGEWQKVVRRLAPVVDLEYASPHQKRRAKEAAGKNGMVPTSIELREARFLFAQAQIRLQLGEEIQGRDPLTHESHFDDWIRDALHPDDPARKATFAELELLRGNHHTALHSLRSLATSKWEKDAYFYAALALAEAKSGERLRAHQAAYRCRRSIPKTQRTYCHAYRRIGNPTVMKRVKTSKLYNPVSLPKTRGAASEPS